MKILLFTLLLATGSVAIAQTYSIKGNVTEKQMGGLPAATVLLLQTGDSTIVRQTTTDTSGVFLLKEINKGEYIFKVSYVGFMPYFKNIQITTADVDIGTIVLRPTSVKLKEVTVIGASVLIKEDTVEYNAGSFSTRPNANVEQLLKKLPGLTLEPDGRIRAQGETVTRIFVDGEEFFGGDLQMATKNLPADAIDKIQVIDSQSEDAQFSGVDDGQREKIINLTLKEDRRSMGFGKATAGVGTANRYVAQANYNRFDKGNQVSVMGSSNNVNNHDFSSDEQEADGAGDSGSNGLVNTHKGGVNILKNLNKQTKLRGSYQLNSTNTIITDNLIRQNFQPEGTALYYENSRQQNNNNGHRATAAIEHKAFRNTIKLNTVFTNTNTQAEAISQRESYSVSNKLVNTGERSSSTQNKNVNLNANLFYGHRFLKKGRVLTLTNQFTGLRSGMEGSSQSLTKFSKGTEEAVRQLNDQQNRNVAFSMQLAYTEPIANKQYLKADYNLTNRSSDSDLEVFDMINEKSLFNKEQSSRFSLDYIYQQLGLTYQLIGNKSTLSVGTHVQQSGLSRKIELPGEVVKKNFQNILPSVNFNQRINRFTQFNIVYNTSVREPAINQIQPVISRYDPLHLYIGNPDLRPEYTHQGRMNLTTFSPASGMFLSGTVNFNYTLNPITSAVSINEQQVRTTQYINLKHSKNFSAFFNAGMPLKKFNSRFNLNPYLRWGQSMNLLNGIAGTTNQQSIGGNLGYTYNYKEILDFNLLTNIDVTHSDYGVNKFLNQFFVNSAYMADATLYFLKKFTFTTEFNYNRFRNPRADFDQAIPVLHVHLSRIVGKNDRGELKLSAINLLNRNLGAAQIATLNYIEQSVQNSLGNFYMLSFTYNLNK